MFNVRNIQGVPKFSACLAFEDSEVSSGIDIGQVFYAQLPIGSLGIYYMYGSFNIKK